MAMFDKKAGVSSGASPEEMECDRRLGELARQRADAITQMGLMFFASNTPVSVADTPFAPYMNTVMEIDKQTAFLEKRKLALRGLRKCEKCGNILVLDSAFCNKCGEKFGPLFAAENAAQHLCPQCGASYADGAAFCTACGYRLNGSV